MRNTQTLYALLRARDLEGASRWIDEYLEQAGGVQDGPLRRQVLQRPAHLQYRADLIPAQHPIFVSLRQPPGNLSIFSALSTVFPSCFCQSYMINFSSLQAGGGQLGKFHDNSSSGSGRATYHEEKFII